MQLAWVEWGSVVDTRHLLMQRFFHWVLLFQFL